MVRRMNLRLRFGRRAIILMLFGIVWLLLGFEYVTEVEARFSVPGTDDLLQFMDRPPWPGLIWIFGGILSITCAFFRNVAQYDAYGFNGLAIPPFIWSASYFLSWIQYQFVADSYGQDKLRESFVFLVITVFVLFVARWPDPDDPLRAKVEVMQ